MKRHEALVDQEANARNIAEARKMRQDIRTWREESLGQVGRLEEERAAGLQIRKCIRRRRALIRGFTLQPLRTVPGRSVCDNFKVWWWIKSYLSQATKQVSRLRKIVLEDDLPPLEMTDLVGVRP